VRLQVRLDPETSGAVERAARLDGVSVSEFTKRALHDRLAARSVKDIARVVADEVCFRLEELIEEKTSPRSETGSEHYTPVVVFKQDCLDSDLHQPGKLCRTCGGSLYTTR